MKKSELKTLLNKEYKNRLTRLGFKKKDDGFIRLNNDSFFYFGFGIVDLDNSFPTTFYWGYGLISVAVILKTSQGKIFDPKQGYPAVIHETQVSLFDKKQYPILEYDLYNEDQAVKMVDDVVQYIEQLLPQFEQLQNVKGVDQKINDGSISQLDSRFISARTQTGLIVAKLTNNPNYETLKSQYRQLLKDWPESDKQELEKVIAFLDQHSREELLKIAESQA